MSASPELEVDNDSTWLTGQHSLPAAASASCHTSRPAAYPLLSLPSPASPHTFTCPYRGTHTHTPERDT